MDFIDHMMFVCLSGAVIGLIFLIMGGIFELIEFLSKGSFSAWIVNLFKE